MGPQPPFRGAAPRGDDRQLKKQAPDQHAAVVADEAHRAVARALVGQAVDQPALGIDDAYWLRRAWDLRGACAPLVALPKREHQGSP